MNPVPRHHSQHPIVVVGTGLAGYTIARELRRLDKDIPITLLTRDDGCFYSKPTLSNALSMKKQPIDLVSVDAAGMAAQISATVRTHCEVQSLAPDRQEITVTGETLRYQSLVLAVGADAKRPHIPGTGQDDILTINDLSDYAQFRAKLEGARTVAIIGAGLIGCEFANDLAQAGYSISLIDPSATPLSRLLPPHIGATFADRLVANGIAFYPGCNVQAMDHCERRYRLTLSSNLAIDADVVISAIGLAARTALASAAGIKVEQGITTDAWCRTNVRNVYALGDCAAIEGHVQSYVLQIMHAARALARTLLGEPTRVQFPVMPITIKTPFVPAVVVSPRVPGDWAVEEAATGGTSAERAVCQSSNGSQLIGFALIGSATKEKASLINMMSTDAP
jgi:rubredoxin-NAD+ reductase